MGPPLHGKLFQTLLQHSHDLPSVVRGLSTAREGDCSLERRGRRLERPRGSVVVALLDVVLFDRRASVRSEMLLGRGRGPHTSAWAAGAELCDDQLPAELREGREKKDMEGRWVDHFLGQLGELRSTMSRGARGPEDVVSWGRTARLWGGSSF